MAGNMRPYRNVARSLAKGKPGSPALPPVIMGTVASVDLTTSPPTVAVNLAGDTSNTATMPFMAHYRPVAGDPVMVHAQGGSKWAEGAMPRNAEILVGPGQAKNIVSGGSDRGNTWPFMFTDSGTITISGDQWAYDTGGLTPVAPTFNGCGWFSVTPGGSASSLGFLTILGGQCSISGGLLYLGGYAQDYNGANIASGNVKVNVAAIGW